ncbi:uncharacterized protein LOC108098764 [Drosophila ficusphila]|uniref:uncharacterized protein LOC108098764 n=1 Tax=Drosophila ficusphila TaxID=30025 RepID=UPI0007E6E6B3|nr:uncharacterized protein LOC108098764 [Drosophila ficusphila]
MVLKISSKFEFANVKCTSLDKEFDEFEYCYIKSVNRSYKYVSLKVNLLQTPIRKVKLQVGLYKKFSGYRPFMYNVTVDLCRFFKNPKSNPFIDYFFSFLRPYSNINHTCPYDNDLMIDKLPIGFVQHQTSIVLPFPEGEYFVESRWIAYDIQRAVVRIYGTIS